MFKKNVMEYVNMQINSEMCDYYWVKIMLFQREYREVISYKLGSLSRAL